MGYNTSAFPEQKLPLSKKTEEWGKECIDAIIAREDMSFLGTRTRKDVMQINYDLYNGIFDEEDFKYITDPYGVGEGFPAALHNFNIIRPKIDLLKGEETKRPNKFVVAKSSHEAASELQDKAKEKLLEYTLAEIASEIQGNESQEDLDELINYITRKYYSPDEKQAFNTLKYLEKYLNIKHVFYKGWNDALIAGEEIYYVGTVNGEPVFERVNPMNFFYDTNPDLDYIEDGDYCGLKSEMSPSGIYNRFYDFLDEEDLDEILKLYGNVASGKDRIERASNKAFTWHSLPNQMNRFKDIDETLVEVYHVCWKSFKKVGFLYEVDPTTNEETVTIVDETYKPETGEIIEWDWIVEVWEGYRIGEDKYVGIRPVSNQTITAENPNGAKLPYIGVAYSNVNSKTKSLVDVMKPVQYMYIAVWYKFEMALAKDKGRILNMDITQIPKSMGINVDRWLHYITASGINLINPYENGFDIPGREGGKPAQFNQISAQDLTMSNVIAGYIQILDKLETMLGELSGVSRQRQGAVSTSELVGNVERAVVQSSHITEPLFWVHNQVKQRALRHLLDVAKFAWKESGKEKLHYIFDDATRVFMNITEDFLNVDHDVFVTDSTQEMQNIESLRTLLQPAMQNGATLLDVAEILTLDNMTSIKEKLEEVENNKTKIEEQMRQQELQLQQQLEQEKLAQLEEDRLFKEQDSIRKSETDIQVALIQAESKNTEQDTSIEYEKLNLEREKTDDEFELEKRKLEEDKRKNMAQERLKQIELEIKRKSANKPGTKTTKSK